MVAYKIVYKSKSGKKLGETTLTYSYGTTNVIKPKQIAGYILPENQTVTWNSVSAKDIIFEYELIEYIITYNLNDGENEQDAAQSYTVESSDITLPIPTKEGNVFEGWYATSNLSGNVVEKITSGEKGNKTLYAKWKENVYYVEYNANGGTGEMEKSTYTYGVEQALKENVFEKEGHEFEGWNTAADGSGTNYADKESVKNLTKEQGKTITLYAKWKKAVTFAVYSADDTSLRFYKRETAPEVNSTFNNLTVTSLYTGFEKTTVPEDSWDFEWPWYEHSEEITQVKVEDVIKPASTAFWFYELRNCFSFDMTNLDTSKVTNMADMFAWTGYRYEIEYNVLYSITGMDNWNTSNVTNMSGMFAGAGNDNVKWNIGDLSTKTVTKEDGTTYTAWDVSNVTNMCAMFASIASNDVWGMDIAEIDSMDPVVLKLSNWDVSNVTDFSEIFNFSGITELNLSNWKTLNNIDMSWGFRDNLFLNKITVSDVINLANTDLVTPSDNYIPGATGKWINEETKKAYTVKEIPNNTAATYVAESSTKLMAFAIPSDNIDGNIFRFYKRESLLTSSSSIEKFKGRIYDGIYIRQIYEVDEEKYYTAENPPPWKGGSPYKVIVEDEISPISTAYWFSGFTWCEYFDLEKLDTSNVTDMSNMFSGIGHELNSITILGLDKWNTSKVTDMSYMFSKMGDYCNEINLQGIGNWDTSSVTTMEGMFSGFFDDWNALNIDISGIENWNTSNVTNMSSMFKGVAETAREGIEFNIGNLNIKTVTKEDGTSYTAWDTSNVKDMSYMFYNFVSTDPNNNIELDLNWNTSKVEDMSYMFSGVGKYADSLKIINLGKWDTSSVKNMSNMFEEAGYYANSVEISGVENFNTSNVTNMNSMFKNISADDHYEVDEKIKDLSIGDLSTKIVTKEDGTTYTAWNTSKVEDMTSMFYRTGYEIDGFVLDVSNWQVSNVTSYGDFNFEVEDKIIAPSFGTSVASLSLDEDTNIEPANITATVQKDSSETVTGVYLNVEDENGIENIMILDAAGNIVKEIILNGVTEYSKLLDITKSGTYFVEVINSLNENKNITFKIE